MKLQPHFEISLCSKQPRKITTSHLKKITAKMQSILPHSKIIVTSELTSFQNVLINLSRVEVWLLTTFETSVPTSLSLIFFHFIVEATAHCWATQDEGWPRMTGTKWYTFSFYKTGQVVVAREVNGIREVIRGFRVFIHLFLTFISLGLSQEPNWAKKNQEKERLPEIRIPGGKFHK